MIMKGILILAVALNKEDNAPSSSIIEEEESSEWDEVDKIPLAQLQEQ